MIHEKLREVDSHAPLGDYSYLEELYVFISYVGCTTYGNQFRERDFNCTHRQRDPHRAHLLLVRDVFKYLN